MEVKNFDDWTIWDGASEGTGRSEKEWLKSDDGLIGLFKYPKSEETTEYISEHLAYKLGELLDVPTAKIDIGTRNNRLGCMSYRINHDNEAIVEGVNFIMGKHPQYNSDSLFDPETQRYYCLEFIFEFFDNIQSIKNFIIQMLLFDFLIGNTDRHQNNWAILVSYEGNPKEIGQVKKCPLYDNGSSLCCYVNEKTVLDYLTTNDLTRFNSFVDSKSRSLIRIDGNEKRRPTHREVIEYLLANYDYAQSEGRRFLKYLDEEKIKALVMDYPKEIISNNRKKLIFKYLMKKREILQEVLNEQCSTRKEK